MFATCTGLKEIVLPDSVESIGKSAFAFCDGLKTFTASAQLSSIGENAFANCSDIKELRLQCNTPPSVEEGAFTKGQYEKTTLYVPKKAMSAYKASAAWNKFQKIKSIDEDDNNWIIYTILLVCSAIIVCVYRYSSKNK